MTGNIHFISAGAGSGKTYTITKKLEELLLSGDVNPAGVIATTFTKLAAGELKEEVRKKLIESNQLDVANRIEQSLIGTVNSVCGDILKRFSFEAGMPPDQRIIDEQQGNTLYYQAMEYALANDKLLIRQMNAICHRLQIINRRKQLIWRGEVRNIVNAARANNQTADQIRNLGSASSSKLLELFPSPSTVDLDAKLLGALNHALSGIDTELDGTKTTRNYLSLITGARAGLIKRRLTWPEWISLTKKKPGKKSERFFEPIAEIAENYAKHPLLHEDIRNFADNVFNIAADSLDAYQELKTQKGLIDFVDQEQRLYQLLNHPSVKETLSEELQVLMVDEFQDTSPIQLALFLKLSRLADQVIWVGDIKQSIYGFRGSDPTLMTAVLDSVVSDGNPPEILENSWRSTPQLVSYTNELFKHAFSNTLSPEQVTLEPVREPLSKEPAVELWRLTGGRKSDRSKALATGVRSMVERNRKVIDKYTNLSRDLAYSDIAILCRTNDNLQEIASALADINLPIRYNRSGLLETPEGCLALACLRRLIDPLDTLATAEIHSLTTCESPEIWIIDRLNHLENIDGKPHQWLEDDDEGPIAKLRQQRDRLPFLTPVETLRAAIDAGNVRETVYKWGPSHHRSQHRLNNIAAILEHAEDYIEQCNAQNEPATAAGLVLWLQLLGEANDDTQASGGDEDAIQLITHHGAKGLEWPIVIATDLDAALKPQIWGLTVLEAPAPISLEDPLAGRTLRYWPKFTGRQSSDINLLDVIENSKIGLEARDREVEESKRLLYVSLTRPRDGLVIAMNSKNTTGPWLSTLDSDWVLPSGDEIELPNGLKIPSHANDFEADTTEIELPPYKPTWLQNEAPKTDKFPLNYAPSSATVDESAKIGEIVELGNRLEVTGEFDPAELGSGLHAVIATSLMGQKNTEGVLKYHGLSETISVKTADECTNRLINTINDKFQPINYSVEYPIKYISETGQIVSGWIDLLLETENGLILIDHKASPRTRSDWEEIALNYSGQLTSYVEGLSKIHEKSVIGRWIHFAVMGGLVEVT
jgi:ATP-dependent helicase/nuclease subunit A